MGAVVAPWLSLCAVFVSQVKHLPIHQNKNQLQGGYTMTAKEIDARMAVELTRPLTDGRIKALVEDFKALIAAQKDEGLL